MLPTIDEAKPVNLATDHLMLYFNDKYQNPENYEFLSRFDYRWVNHVDSPNSDKSVSEILEDDIISLCIKTDFCKQTGLSYLDILKLEFPLYRKIRDRMYDSVYEKSKKQADIKRETEMSLTRASR